MSNVHYFQRYHSKENTHSANACLLLSRLYRYNHTIFYNVLSQLFELEKQEFEIQFNLQEKKRGSNSIPDFVVSQSSFKLVVEAKEKDNQSRLKQFEKHAEYLSKENYANKFLILLSPTIGDEDKEIINSIKQRYQNIICKCVTYEELCSVLQDNLDNYKDYYMLEILDDYIDYCDEESLTDRSKETIMVRLAGDTFDFDIENNVYYDSANHKSTGFSYLGLYKNKKVEYIGKIKKIITCKLENGIIANKNNINKEFLELIEKCVSFQKMKGNNIDSSYTYFIVEEFAHIDNFVKTSKYALYGKKKFYLSQFGLKANSTINDIANAMSNKKWEDLVG